MTHHSGPKGKKRGEILEEKEGEIEIEIREGGRESRDLACSVCLKETQSMGGGVSRKNKNKTTTQRSRR